MQVDLDLCSGLLCGTGPDWTGLDRAGQGQGKTAFGVYRMVRAWVLADGLLAGWGGFGLAQ